MTRKLYIDGGKNYDVENKERGKESTEHLSHWREFRPHPIGMNSSRNPEPIVSASYAMALLEIP
jgi:hypothetical protein